MVRLPLALLVALCALAALPAAHAQAGANDPRITVTLEVAPKEPTIPLGGQQTFLVNVKLATSNIFCSSQGSVTVALALKDTGLAGVAGSLPASVNVPVRANVQPPAITGANSEGNATAPLTVAVAGNAAPDHTHSFTVTANTPAALPSGCQALSAVPPPAATATADVSLKTGAASAGTTTSRGAGTSSSAPPATTQESFFLPMQLQVATLLALGLLARRAA